jgi:hypothetical protein
VLYAATPRLRPGGSSCRSAAPNVAGSRARATPASGSAGGAIGEWDDGTWLVGAQIRDRGTGWVIAEAKRLQAEYDCAIVVDGAGPAKELVPKLEDADLDLVITSTDEYVTACSTFYDGIDQAQITHMGDDELEAAVRVAVRRDVGGDGRWAWGRRKSAGDVSMLEAVTLAWFGRELGWYDVGDSVL